MISKSSLVPFLGIDDPKKEKFRFAIKGIALASSGKGWGKGNAQFYARSTRTVDEKAALYKLVNVCIDNALILRYIV